MYKNFNDILYEIRLKEQKEKEKNLSASGIEYVFFPPTIATKDITGKEITSMYFYNVLQIAESIGMIVETFQESMRKAVPYTGVHVITSLALPCRLINYSEDESISHSHAFIELIYVYKGQFATIIENERHIYYENQICIMDMNCEHRELLSECNGIAFSLDINPSAIDDYFIKKLTAESIRNFFLVSIGRKTEIRYLSLQLCANDAGTVWDSLAVIYNELQQRQTGFKKIIQIHLLRILNLLRSEDYSEITLLPARLSSELLYRAMIIYINQNIATVSLENLEKEFHYQRDYYSRLLKKKTGMSFSEYVTAVRMERLKDLLTHTDHKVKDIAFSLGFENMSYFYHCVKKQTGATPEQLRRELKQDAPHTPR